MFNTLDLDITTVFQFPAPQQAFFLTFENFLRFSIPVCERDITAIPHLTGMLQE